MSLNQITIAPIFPLWLIILLLVLGLAAVIFQYRLIRKRLGRNRALGLSLLRLAAISLLISFALNPSRAERREHEASPAWRSSWILLKAWAFWDMPGKEAGWMRPKLS